MAAINGNIVQYLKRIITILQRDIKLKNERLRRLEDLKRSHSESEEKLQSWKTKAESYKADLRRAEATIADLHKKLGIGPQTALCIDVVHPGISRTDFDANTRENIELKEASKYFAPTEMGTNVVVDVS